MVLLRVDTSVELLRLLAVAVKERTSAGQSVAAARPRVSPRAGAPASGSAPAAASRGATLLISEPGGARWEAHCAQRVLLATCTRCI
jgi:hypothetical protein